jgi:hypothetical protein
MELDSMASIDGKTIPIYSRPKVRLNELMFAMQYEYRKAKHVADQMGYGENFSDLGLECTFWKVIPVLEPLKVRVITKGPEFRQNLLKPLQLSLHGHLRKDGRFRALDHPLSESDINLFLYRTDQVYPAGASYVSGDYSAATDKMNIFVTLRIVQRICERFYSSTGNDRLVEEIQRATMSLMGGSVLMYDFHTDKDADSKDPLLYANPIRSPAPFRSCFQNNGQLMGSILSFPVLCIGNLAAFYLSRTRMCEQRDTRFLNGYIHHGYKVVHPIRTIIEQNHPVLVNGDDIVFPIDSSNEAVEYDIWSRTVSEFGFVKSLGKNYVSKSCLMINSMLFSVLTETRPFSELRHHYAAYLPYYNVGLVSGQSKVVGRVEGRNRPVASILQEVLDGAMDSSLAFGRYLRRNAEDVDKATGGGLVNIFLPREVGGLGVLDPRNQIQKYSTNYQRFLGTNLIRILVNGCTRQEMKDLLGAEEVSDEKGSNVLQIPIRRNGKYYLRNLCDTYPHSDYDRVVSIHALAYRASQKFYVQRNTNIMNSSRRLLSAARARGISTVQLMFPDEVLRGPFMFVNSISLWGPTFNDPKLCEDQIYSCEVLKLLLESV